MSAEKFTALVEYITKWFKALMEAFAHAKDYITGKLPEDITADEFDA